MSMSSRLFEFARMATHRFRERWTTRLARAHRSKTEDFDLAPPLLEPMEQRLYMSSNPLAFDFATSEAVVGLQADSRILVAGESSGHWSIYRIASDGTVDGSFGDAGHAEVDIGTNTQLTDLAFDTSGRFLLAGNVDGDIVIARFLNDGQLDLTFGVNGLATFDLGGDDFVNSLTVDGQSIYAVGGRDGEAAVLKISSTGEADSSFGTLGTVILNSSSPEQGMALEVQSDELVLATLGKKEKPSIERLSASDGLQIKSEKNQKASPKEQAAEYERLVELANAVAVQHVQFDPWTPLDVSLVSAPGWEAGVSYGSPFAAKVSESESPMLEEFAGGGASMMLSVPSGFEGPLVFDPDGEGPEDPVDTFGGFDWAVGNVLSVGMMSSLDSFLSTATVLNFGSLTLYVSTGSTTITPFEQVTQSFATSVLADESISGLNTDFAYSMVNGIDLVISTAMVTGNNWTIGTFKAPAGGSWFEVYYVDLSEDDPSLFNDGTLIYASEAVTTSGSRTLINSGSYQALDYSHTGLQTITSAGSIMRMDVTTYYNTDFIVGLTPLHIVDAHTFTDSAFTPLGQANDYFVLDAGGATTSPATLAGAGAPTDTVLGIGSINGKFNSISGPSMQAQTDGASSIKFAYRLVENSDFVTEITQSTTRSSTYKSIRFQFKDLGFDTTGNEGELRDAFEVALVDENGNSLVGTIGQGKDAFFNISDGLDPVLGAGATYSNGVVTLDVSHVAVGTTMYLKARLVNNDPDTDTAVTLIPGISGLTTQITGASLVTPLGNDSAEPLTPAALNLLSDVSGLVDVEYQNTTFDDRSNILFAGLELTNSSVATMRGPVLVAVKILANPNVSVANADGYTPDGLAYFDLTALAALAAGADWNPDETITGGAIQFYNPDRVQFDHELIILGQLNHPPQITSEPPEAVQGGKTLTYQVTAEDLDGDSLTYSVVAGPSGLSVDETGVVTWTTLTSDVGSHVVTLRVEDGFGGRDEQVFSIAVLASLPNRPPLFTSLPIVDAYVGQQYVYQATAIDADGDTLTFDGDLAEITDEDFGVSAAGLVTWTPDASVVGQLIEIELMVTDDQDPAGAASQVYRVYVHPAQGNHAPIIVSAPGLIAIPDKDYVYLVRALDHDGDELAYAFDGEEPEGMTIDQETGQIDWSVPTLATGTHDITVVVSDGRGGVTRQMYELSIGTATGSISGHVYLDYAGNGIRDDAVAELALPVNVYDLPDGSLVLQNEPVYARIYGGLVGSSANSGWFFEYQDRATLEWMGTTAPILRFVDPTTETLEWVSVLSDGNGPNDDDELAGFDAPAHIGDGVIRNTASINGVSVQADTVLIGNNLRTTYTFAADDLDGLSFAFFAENNLGPETNDQASFSGSLANSDVIVKQTASPDGGLSVALSGTAVTGATMTSFGSGSNPSFGSSLGAGDFDVLSDDGSSMTTYGDLGLAIAFDLTGSTATVVVNFYLPDNPALQATVFDDANDNGIWDSGEVYTETNSNGEYELDSLYPGTHILRIYDSETGTVGHVSPHDSNVVELAMGASVENIDFGVQRWFSAIQGVIWDDLDGDGGQSPFEQGLAGVTVYLDLNLNEEWDENEPFVISQSDDPETPRIDESGGYEFNSLLPGWYVVRQVVPEGRIQTYPGHADTSDIIIPISRGQFLPSNATPITFDELPLYTEVTDQYQEELGITFGGYFTGQSMQTVTGSGHDYVTVIGDPDSPLAIDPESPVPIISGDASSPTNPVLMNNNPFLSKPIAILFDEPQVSFAIIGGGFDNIGSVAFVAYDEEGHVLGQVTNAEVLYPFTGLAVADGQTPLIKGILIHIIAQEFPGFGIDNVYIGAPTVPGLHGGHVVELLAAQVNSGNDFGSRTDELSQNESPVFVSVPPNVALIDETYVYEPYAFAAKDGPAAFDLVVAPEGMAIDSVTGVVAWVPQEAQLGDHTVVLRATDQAGRSSLQTFTLEARHVNQPPVFVSLLTDTAVVEVEYSVALQATDPNGDDVTFHLVRGPSGLEIDSEGVLTWTPTAVGDYQVTIEARDGRGWLTIRTFEIPVRDTVPPVFTTVPSSSAIVGEEWTYEVEAIDPDEGTVSYSLDELSLARGMVLVGTELSWTPPLAGEFVVTLTATDDEGAKRNQQFTLMARPAVVASLPPKFTSSPTGPAIWTYEWTYQLAAVDPDTEGAVTFALVGETYPSGFELSGDTLSWTPPEESPTTVAVTVSATGADGMVTYQSFVLPVRDDTSSSDTPEFTSVPDEWIRAGEVYRYLAHAVDPNSDPLTYSLIAGPAGMTIDAQTGLVQWSPKLIGEFQVQLRVSDSVNTADQVFTIDVAPPITLNGTPNIISVPTGPAVADVAWKYQVVATDPNGDPLTYAVDAVSTARGVSIDAQTGLMTWTPSRGGRDTITVTADDSHGGIATQSFTLPVMDNAPPVFTSQPSIQMVGLEDDFEYTVSAEDPNAGDTLTFALVDSPSGMTITPTSATTADIEWEYASYPGPGIYQVHITVTDDRGESTWQKFEIRVVDDQSNDAPSITSSPRTAIQLGQVWRYQVQATDPDFDELTVSLVAEGFPAGMTIDNRGLVQWTPQPGDVGSHSVMIRVDDGRGETIDQTFTIDVVSQPRNSRPVITSIPMMSSASATTGFVYQAQATDADNDALFWTLEAAPAGMMVNPITGLVTFSAAPDQVGIHTVLLRVTDTFGAGATQEFDLQIRGANLPPMILSTPKTFALAGSPYRYDIRATDPDGDSTQLLFELDATSITRGMTIESGTNDVVWSSPTAGTYDVTVWVMDIDGDATPQTYTFEVTDPTAGNLVPVITSTPPSTYIGVGTEYEYEVAVHEPNGDDVTYAVDSASQTLGISIDSYGVLTWTPDIGDIGVHEVVVTVTDDDTTPLSTTQTFWIDVNGDGPELAAINDFDLAALGMLDYTVSISNTDGQSLTFTLVDAPAGMVISNVGRITWNSQVEDVDEDYDVTVRVTDQHGNYDEDVFNVAVAADTANPHVVIHVDADTIAVGSTLTIHVSAADNVAVQSLTLTVDSVNLAIDSQGFARWTPTSTGEFDIVAIAADVSSNSTETDPITITVYDPSAGSNAAPLVAIVSPTEGQTITDLVDIIGIVDDPDEGDTVTYSLSLTPVGANGQPGTLIEFSSGTAEVTSAGILGDARLDPTLLANGTYLLRLTATDNHDATSIIETLVQIDSRLKLGNFRLSFTDLSLSLAGIPITIGRTYDTLNIPLAEVGQGNDFGVGWQLDLTSISLSTDVQPTGQERAGNYAPFREGTRVYVTLPDGTREGFTFRAIPMEPPSGSDSSGDYAAYLLSSHGGIASPSFVADPGNTTTLKFNQNSTIVSDGHGGYLDPNRLAFNPASPFTGSDYLLTTQDGTIFQLRGDTGELRKITDRNGNTLSITTAGISARNSEGETIAAVTFQRDHLGRIVSVTDPAGNAILYKYDAAGDLIKVTDRAGSATDYLYDAPQDHYLTEIIDARGVSVMELNYDETTGRIISLTDASGADIPFSYDLNHRAGEYRERLADADDIVTELIRDSRGNVIRRIQQADTESDPELRAYVVTVYQYDKDNRQTRESVPFEVIGETNAYDAQPTAWMTERTFDDFGNILSETDALGHETQYQYDAYGNVTTTIDALGNATHNSYDTRGNLTTTADALGNITTFSYLSGNLTGVTDALGRTVANFAYDTKGQILSVSSLTGITTYFGYDDNGNQTHSWYIAEHITGSEDPSTIVTRTAYDAAGRVTATQQFELIDAAITSFTELLTALESADPLISTGTTYNAAGQVFSSVDPYGNITENYYNARGLLTLTRSQTQDEDGLDQWIVSITVYDANGRPIYTADPIIEAFTTDLDESRVVELTQTIYDPLGHVTATKRVTGLTVDFTLAGTEENTRLETETTGTPTDLWESSAEYDAQSRITRMVSPTGASSEYIYDVASRLIEAIVDLDGDEETTEDRASTLYTYDALGRQLAVTDALAHTTRFTYDVLGRLLRTTFHDDTFTETEYDAVGRRIAETDQLGRTTDYEYDEAGRLTGVVLPEVSDGDPESLTFEEMVRPRYEYGYDDQGNMTTITDPKGRVTTFGFDAFGRQVSRELPLAQTESMQYNDMGQPTLAIDFVDRHTAYIYDEHGRLEEKQYFIDETAYDDGEGTPDRTIAYTYDAFGRVLTIDDSIDGITAYTYSARGHLLQVDRSAATDESIINYAYNDLDQLVRTWTSTDSAGEYIITENIYAYDPFGRVESVTQTWRNSTDITDETTAYIYDLLGNLDKIVNANGVVADYDYDDLYRVVLLTHFQDDDEDLTLDEGEDIVASFEYEVDAAGNRVAATEAFDADNDGDLDAVQTFGWEYDGLNRLTRETFDSPNNALDYEAIFTFDLSSNRMTQVKTDTGGTDTTSYEYDNNDRLLEEDSSVTGATTYTYNAAGDQTSKSAPGVDTVNYRYDAMGRMVGVDTDDDTIDDVTYVYDSNGTRVAQTENSDTRTYVYDIQNLTGYAKPIEEYVDGDLDRSYTTGFMIHGQWDATDGAVQLVHDAHGSTRGLLDSDGDSLELYTYEAFGDAVGFAATAAGTTWLFAGDGSFDAGTGFTYHLARWRDGARFTSMDPYAGNISSPLEFHEYLYVLGNSIHGLDPSGLWNIPEFVVTAAVWTEMIALRAMAFVSTYSTAFYTAQRLVAISTALSFIFDQDTRDFVLSQPNPHLILVGLFRQTPFTPRQASAPRNTSGTTPAPTIGERVEGVAQRAFNYAVENPRVSGLSRMNLGKDAEVQATRWLRRWAEHNSIPVGPGGLRFQVRGANSVPDVVFDMTRQIFDFKLSPASLRPAQTQNFINDFPGFDLRYIYGPDLWR